MGYLTNAFKLTQSQRRIMQGLVTILVLTSNHVQAAEANAMLPDVQTVETAQVEPNDTKTLGFTVPTAAGNDLPKAGRVPAVRTYRVSMTAYNSEEAQTDDTPFIAADGTHVFDGMIAANFLKFKTRVRIPELFGDKVFVVHDRMNKRYTDRVDVWMEHKSDALKFGVKRNVLIEIL
jgi:3D (Asp-Asp-Asp) domain-containing protein